MSRAINDHSDVSKRTKERVRAAAEELGYSANLSARSLVTLKSGMVSLIRPGGLSSPSDASILETISGLSNEFFERGKQFVLHMMPPETDPLPIYRNAVASGSFDGFVLFDTRQNDARVELLEEMGAAYVVHGRAQMEAEHRYFDIDNFEVAKDHVAHLAGLGHRHIALINGPNGFAYSDFRLLGYKAGLEAAGLTFDPENVVNQPMTQGNGMISTARLMTDRPNRPTALICSNVFLAKGAYAALQALELQIPEDVSVTAHDDVLYDVRASAFYPALTVTRAPFSASWSKLADILCAEIDGDASVASQVVEKSEFIVRASSAPPP